MEEFFSLNKLKTEEDILETFYKIVFYHLKEKIPGFDNNWAKVYIKTSKMKMHTSMGVIVSESTKFKTDSFEEQSKLFRELILSPNSALKHESNLVRTKAFRLKDCIESIDTDGIHESWWKKRGLSLAAGSLGSITSLGSLDN